MGACQSNENQIILTQQETDHFNHEQQQQQQQQQQQNSQNNIHSYKFNSQNPSLPQSYPNQLSQQHQQEIFSHELPKNNDLYNIYSNQIQNNSNQLNSNRNHSQYPSGFSPASTENNTNAINGEQISAKNSSSSLAHNAFNKKPREELPSFIYEFSPPDEKDKLKQYRPAQRLPNGSVYVGEWISNKMDGKGILTWPDGSKYEGFFIDGMRQGRGRFTSSDGDIFEGEWRANKADGFGTQYTDLSTYTGEWCDDLQEGIGEEEWIDGSKYKGQYSKGKKHGRGTFTWYDGTRYEGAFDEGSISGVGTMHYHNGKKYEGEFKLGKLHGKGCFTWQDSKSYTGDYVDDIKHGHGVFKWPDGRKYEGGWVNGNQHGVGVFYDKQGEPRKGEWNQGVHIRWIDFDLSQQLLHNPQSATSATNTTATPIGGTSIIPVAAVGGTQSNQNNPNGGMTMMIATTTAVGSTQLTPQQGMQNSHHVKTSSLSGNNGSIINDRVLANPKAGGNLGQSSQQSAVAAAARQGSFNEEQQFQSQVFQLNFNDGDNFETRLNSTSDLKIPGTYERSRMKGSSENYSSQLPIQTQLPPLQMQSMDRSDSQQLQQQQQSQIPMQNGSKVSEYRTKKQNSSIHQNITQGQGESISPHHSHLMNISHSNSASYLHRL